MLLSLYFPDDAKPHQRMFAMAKNPFVIFGSNLPCHQSGIFGFVLIRAVIPVIPDAKSPDRPAFTFRKEGCVRAGIDPAGKKRYNGFLITKISSPACHIGRVLNANF